MHYILARKTSGRILEFEVCQIYPDAVLLSNMTSGIRNFITLESSAQCAQHSAGFHHRLQRLTNVDSILTGDRGERFREARACAQHVFNQSHARGINCLANCQADGHALPGSKGVCSIDGSRGTQH
jgi:hypothetical protein